MNSRPDLIPATSAQGNNSEVFGEVFWSHNGPQKLADLFQSVDYTVDVVLNRLGAEGQQGLARNQTMPALTALGDADDLLANLVRLFPLQQTVSRRQLASGVDVDWLIASGILCSVPQKNPQEPCDGVCASVDIRPYGFTDTEGTWEGWIAADPIPGLDSCVTKTHSDYVLGVSPASTSLAQMTLPGKVGSALDLGAGCGVQSAHLSRHADKIVATDVNPRALAMARLTMAMNGIDADIRSGSLYEPVAHDRFDLIVTNPPYVMSPPSRGKDRLVYREGGFTGDGLVRELVSHAYDHLTDGGMLQVLANWADTASVNWQDRLANWIANTGCDLWVVEREHLDIYSYIEMWLTDAGLAGDPTWSEKYRQWLDYFGHLGITGVGMGWIMVRNSGVNDPRVTLEQWPYQIEQPIGTALAQAWKAADSAAVVEDILVTQKFRLANDVIQETTGMPGAPDPAHIVLRQKSGLCRAMEVDTALGGVIGACDGELSLGVLIGAVAKLIDRDAEELSKELLPQLRIAIRDGFIV